MLFTYTTKPGTPSKVLIIVCVVVLMLCTGVFFVTKSLDHEKEEKALNDAQSVVDMYEKVAETIALHSDPSSANSAQTQRQIARWEEKWPDFTRCVATYSDDPEGLQRLTEKAKAERDARWEEYADKAAASSKVSDLAIIVGVFDLIVLLLALYYRSGWTVRHKNSDS